jgi:hypothetical protein
MPEHNHVSITVKHKYSFHIPAIFRSFELIASRVIYAIPCVAKRKLIWHEACFETAWEMYKMCDYKYN